MAFNSFSLDRDVGESQSMLNQRAVGAPTNTQIIRVQICLVTGTKTRTHNTRGREGRLRAGGRPDNKLPYRLQASPGPPGQQRSTAGNKKLNFVSWSVCQRSHGDKKRAADNT